MASSWAFSHVTTLREVTRKKKGQRVLASQAVWEKHRIGPEDSHFRSLMLPRTSCAALDSSLNFADSVLAELLPQDQCLSMAILSSVPKLKSEVMWSQCLSRLKNFSPPLTCCDAHMLGLSAGQPPPPPPPPAKIKGCGVLKRSRKEALWGSGCRWQPGQPAWVCVMQSHPAGL